MLPPFLLTRPAAQSDRFAEQLRARFGPQIRIVSSPLLAPRFLAPALPEVRWRGLIFTSETGVAAYRQLSAGRGMAAWCVGGRTAEAARLAGFDARSAGGDADDLLTLLLASGATGPLLHARGQDVTGNLSERLNSAGIETFQAVVYAQRPQPLTPEAATMLASDAPIIAPLFSPRTAALFAASPCVLSRRAPLWLAALSSAVAVACAPAKAQRTVLASRPDTDALIEALAEFLATPSPALKPTPSKA